MKRVLHIIKNATSKEALNLIEQQAKVHPEEVTILLIQEAVRLTPLFSVPIYVLEEDLKARGVLSPFESIDYKKMLELILTTDRVMTW